MNDQPVYLDTSALGKLVHAEAETPALIGALARWPDRLSSDLAAVELRRLVARLGASPQMRADADALLGSLTLLRVEHTVLTLAGRLGDAALRTLDALHIASALSIGDLPIAFVTYDARQAEAAARAGLQVEQPGLAAAASPRRRRAARRTSGAWA